jgi:hypothetical protein
MAYAAVDATILGNKKFPKHRALLLGLTPIIESCRQPPRIRVKIMKELPPYNAKRSHQ